MIEIGGLRMRKQTRIKLLYILQVGVAFVLCEKGAHIFFCALPPRKQAFLDLTVKPNGIAQTASILIRTKAGLVQELSHSVYS